MSFRAMRIILSPLYDFAYAFVEFLYDCMYTYIYVYVLCDSVLCRLWNPCYAVYVRDKVSL